LAPSGELHYSFLNVVLRTEYVYSSLFVTTNSRFWRHSVHLKFYFINRWFTSSTC